MDKYEYKVRAEEIHNLIAEGEFALAVEIADTIDWRRVKSIKTLCTISDLYKINRRYQESKEILLMAYERYPGGRLIVYSLCELSIKLEEYVQAIEYYKEYVQLAPKDANRYILQYRLYEAQDVSLEERIEVLEDFKSKDYREKWAYELAYLYHRMGLSSKCVDECDELIVTFGEGKYVIKAMELKALHEPLSPSQQALYDSWTTTREEDEEPVVQEITETRRESVSDVPGSTDAADLQGAPTTELPEEIDIQVSTVDVGQYNTMNLQEAIAESMKDIWGTTDEIEPIPSTPEEEVEDNTIFGTGPLAGPKYAADPDSFNVETWENTGEIPTETVEPVANVEEEPQIQATDIPVSIPVSAGGTREVYMVSSSDDVMSEETKRIPTEAVVDYIEAQKLRAQMEMSTASLQASDVQAESIPGAITGQLEGIANISSEYDQMLAQEYDGQIRLAISEAEQIEKQITGQLSIDDILAGWEETKKENEKKREEEVRMRILQHTGSLFDEFDEDTKAALLEQLEKAFMDAIVKESKAGVGDSEELGKKIRKEALRAVEYLSKDNIISANADEVAQAEEAKEEREQIAAEEVDNVEADAEDEVVEETDVVDDTTEESSEAAVLEDNSEETVSEEETADDEVAEDVVDDESAEDVTDDESVEDIEADVSEEDTVSDESEEDEAADSDEVKAVRQALQDDEDEVKEAKNAASAKVVAEPQIDEEGNRVLSDEEEELFAAYVSRKSTRKQIINALDNMSMAAYTGNCIVTGEEGVGTMDLAKLLIKQMQTMDSNFVGKQIASIPGKKLNGKDIPGILDKLNGGALVIEKARGMKKSTVESLMKSLENENLGILVIVEDTSEGVDRIISVLPKFAEIFNVRIDLKALDDKALVNIACEYAVSQEYSIDEFAVLALHSRIAELQTADHQVTVAEVKELVDDAIYYADKKNIKHFFDIILRKRYDSDDMIILREQDFMHY